MTILTAACVAAPDGPGPASGTALPGSGPAGGPDGTLVLTANSWLRPLVAPEGSSSSLMAVSATRGRGPWRLVRSPIDPPQSATCRHYSSPVFPLDATGRVLEIEAGVGPDATCSTFVGVGVLP